MTYFRPALPLEPESGRGTGAYPIPRNGPRYCEERHGAGFKTFHLVEATIEDIHGIPIRAADVRKLVEHYLDRISASTSQGRG